MSEQANDILQNFPAVDMIPVSRGILLANPRQNYLCCGRPNTALGRAFMSSLLSIHLAPANSEWLFTPIVLSVLAWVLELSKPAQPICMVSEKSTPKSTSS